MKNRMLYIILGCLCLTQAAYSRDYYWYKGHQIFLRQGNMRYALYDKTAIENVAYFTITEKGNVSDDGDHNLRWCIVDKNNAIDTSLVVYQMPSFLCSDATKNMFITHRFYVKLKRSSDIILLQELVNRYNAKIEKAGDFPLWYIISCKANSHNNALELSNVFYESGLFEAAEPEFFHAIQVDCANDYLFEQQWNLKNTGQFDIAYNGIDVNYCAAQLITSGDSSIIIGVYDTGVDLTHPDINLYSFSFDAHTGTSPSTLIDTKPHGTKCAGVIGAKTNNIIGVAGIAPNCPIMSLSWNSVTSSELGNGFKVAADHNCSVISNSWSYEVPSSYVDEGIEYAISQGRNGKGCVVVFAAGNNNGYVQYPANSNDDILVVGALSPCGERKNPDSCDGESWWGSSYGDKLDIMAPGVKIRTTDIAGSGGSSSNDYVNNFNGTSSACPHVSGIAGLILSVNPYLTQKEVADIIESTAQKVGPSYIHYETETGRPNGTWNFEMGYGLVDAYAAVNKAKNTQIRGPYSICDTAKYYLIHPSQSGETVSWSVENGDMIGPYYYSIIGDDDQDTVLVKCEYIYSRFGYDSVTVPTLDHRQYLSVTISTNDTSETYTKTLHGASNNNPNISASNSSMLWPINTQRTFTITNCSLIADSLLHWRVQTTFSRPQPITLTGHFYGQTLTYTPQTPPGGKISTIRIFASNEKPSICGEAYSDTLLFIVPRNTALLTNQFEQDLLNVYITEDSEESSHELLQLDENSNYTLELWHNIYGRMCEQTVHTPNIQMSTSELSQGIYVLILKENGNVIAETKVQIN